MRRPAHQRSTVRDGGFLRLCACSSPSMQLWNARALLGMLMLASSAQAKT
ncbi:hypothetical protein SAMN00790413_06282 [Deinococcus hopiensis KR-140]|uniref:Uncharacterized protein n=1 Tax=Deinococcus hopiensis KR-140 TaxID=695939 RepID=A0A1W1VVV6_9DEIO|nr:hypothetical protein SAMN00790413_06282 [Deinococcus hopiensis KR-140]